MAHAQTSLDETEMNENYCLMGTGLEYPYIMNGISEEIVSIVGHTPTNIIRYYTGEPQKRPFEIYINRYFIGTDCGCGFREDGGQLGCLRLNDLECFYA